ncbi:MAG: photosynthetic reaction center cytochrome c subunit [Myxococcaceae bacterium]|nr:photosynthetic reaction center cytochrome c subunit [Myxococcaceae bacterium]
MSMWLKVTGTLLVVALGMGVAATFKKVEAFQQGYPGVGMELLESDKALTAKVKANVVPPPLPPAAPGGQLAVDAYKNVQVLGHLTSGEMTRLMTAMTTWVAPEQGCAYCHAPKKDANGNPEKDEDGYVIADPNNMYSDELYTKRVARRMLQMTMHINQDWQAHVKGTGVTCYTCHRGNPVPATIWFDTDAPRNDDFGGNNDYQNVPSGRVATASLPHNGYEVFLKGNANIRVISEESKPNTNRSSIKQTEWTYGLMMHMSNSLGVNCTYCHNTRSMAEWSTSPPQRTTAWYGIRMVRGLNNEYLIPLTDQFPDYRKGPHGDAPKLNCATCHNQAYKPLLGVSMLKDYVVLAEAKPQPAKTPVEPPPAEVPAEGATPAEGAPPTPAP